MDQCFFAVNDKYGNFSRCKALQVGCCPDGCKFRKTEFEYYAAIARSEKRLRDLGLTAVDRIEADGRHTITVVRNGGE